MNGEMLAIGICAGALACMAAVPSPGQGNPASAPHSIPALVSEDPSPTTPALAAAEEADLRQELMQHPDSAELLYKLALVLREENKPKESLETYTRAAQLLKPDADQLRSVGLDYVLLNDYEDAVRWLQTAVATDPDNVDVLYSLGRCLYTQGRYAEAEEQYLRVLQRQPWNVKAEENLGLAYDASNEPEKAEAALAKAASWAAVGKSDEWPFLNFGSFLLDHDKPFRAVAFLDRAISIAPASAIGHEKLGRALEEMGRPLQGVKELEIAAGLDPKNPNIHFELGHAYHQVGELEKAKAEFATSHALRKERDQR